MRQVRGHALTLLHAPDVGVDGLEEGALLGHGELLDLLEAPHVTADGPFSMVTDALGQVTKTTYDALTQRVDKVIVAQGPNERRTKTVWQNGLLKETRVWNPTPGGGGEAYNASYFSFYDQADRLAASLNLWKSAFLQ